MPSTSATTSPLGAASTAGSLRRRRRRSRRRRRRRRSGGFRHRHPRPIPAGCRRSAGATRRPTRRRCSPSSATFAARPEVARRHRRPRHRPTRPALDDPGRRAHRPVRSRRTSSRRRSRTSSTAIAQNPLRYVVIVGNDDAIPFFRYPDQSLLGPGVGLRPAGDDATRLRGQPAPATTCSARTSTALDQTGAHRTALADPGPRGRPPRRDADRDGRHHRRVCRRERRCRATPTPRSSPATTSSTDAANAVASELGRAAPGRPARHADHAERHLAARTPLRRGPPTQLRAQAARAAGTTCLPRRPLQRQQRARRRLRDQRARRRRSPRRRST